MLLRIRSFLIVLLIFLSQLPFAEAVVKGRQLTLEEVSDSPIVKIEFPNQNICSGTLLNDWVVLTAAHCLRGSKNLNVVIHYKVDGNLKRKRHLMKTFEVMPRYDLKQTDLALRRAQSKYDLALLWLTEPAAPTKPRAALAKPKDHSWLVANLYQLPVMVMGFGATTKSVTTQAPSQGIGFFTDPTTVKGLEGDESLADQFQINHADAVFMDGNKGASMCFGDSGGPVLAKIGEEWKIIAVNSFVLGSQPNTQSCIKGSIHAPVTASENAAFLRAFLPE